MVGNVTIQGQITGTATFDGAKISAVVTVAPQINATVDFGGGISTVEQLPAPVSDSSNVYAWIRGTLLTGLDVLSDVAIDATDTILQGFAKLQGQINTVKVRLGLLESRLIVDWTATVSTNSITITTFADGQPLLLSENSEFVIDIISKSNSTVFLNGYIRLNNNINTVYIENGVMYSSFHFSQKKIGQSVLRFSVLKNQIFVSGGSFMYNELLANPAYQFYLGATVESSYPGAVTIPITSMSLSLTTFLPDSRVIIKQIR